MQLAKIAFLLFLITCIPEFAHAYIGPGLGAGTIGVILGIVGSVFIALFAVIWYPLKRILRKKRKSETGENNK